jgi:GTPase SAR1 family protein
MNNFSIALLGAKASGKSNYIGVLINEIRRKMTGPFNCSLSITSSQETKQAYEDIYYRPLYIEGHTVLATAGGQVPPPLIFPLRFMDENNNIVNMAALTFYDTAGENLDDINVIRKFNSYIINAHGIIMLLDPLQVPNIRNKLTANGFSGLPEQNTETAYILSTIMDTMRNIKNVKGQIDIPLALVFTKIDVLEKYNILPENSCLRNESEHINRGVFLKFDFDNTNTEVQDLLENWLDGEIIGFLKQFKKYSFFGVSALGANPAGTTIDSMGIRPRRVLDPLLWLLAENGYIKTSNR